MDFAEYQKESRKTAHQVKVEADYIYPVLGLAGEVGELLNKIKKISRDDGGAVSEKHRRDIEHELGDILWYLTQIATEFDLKMDEIAEHNLHKLFSRKDRGKITGSGDWR